MDRRSFLKRAVVTVAVIAAPKTLGPSPAVANPAKGTVVSALNGSGQPHSMVGIEGGLMEWEPMEAVFTEFPNFSLVNGWALHDQGHLLAAARFDEPMMLGPGDRLNLALTVKYE